MRPQAIAEKARRGDKKGDLRECLDDLDAKLQAKEAEINEAAAAVQIHNLLLFSLPFCELCCSRVWHIACVPILRCLRMGRGSGHCLGWM